ncbi:MAG: glycosyltransferase family 4 protein [Deltaproteobacteria bacterium]|nr:glycosyltransferase family 4 protein [Deltaproteobacteria bacterium]MBW2341459.1 glycosyltransferase family 4 protein [Deltaproteobacteria bacterium]
MQGRIKVVHIITRMDRGGSAQNTLLTCQELSQKYGMVLAHGLSRESKMTDQERQSVERQITEAQERGLKDIPVASLVRRIDPVRDFFAFFSILRVLIREKPAIVHTHTYKAGILGCWAAKMAGVPVIVHTPHGHVFFGHFSPLVTRFFMIIERLTASIIDCMIALTEGERNDYISFSIVNPNKMVTIHSGVDVTPFVKARVNIEEKKKCLGLNTKGLVVGTIGWLLPIKGPLCLLKAMGIVWQTRPQIQLVYVGKGDLEQDLRKEAYRIGVFDKVRFLGWRDDIPEIMQILDIFVLPSLNEGMGRVLVEAMAAGKPIVGSNVGGIPDLVKDGQNGFLVESCDSNSLSFAIKKLLDNKKMREEMGEKGRAMAGDYSVEKMIEEIDGLYASLFHEKISA